MKTVKHDRPGLNKKSRPHTYGGMNELPANIKLGGQKLYTVKCKVTFRTYSFIILKFVLPSLAGYDPPLPLQT